MPRSTVSILLSFLVQASSDELAASETDKLIDRVLHVLPFHHAALDTTVLEKPGHLAIRQKVTPFQPSASPLGPRHSSLVPGSSHILSRPHQHSIFIDSAKSWDRKKSQIRPRAIQERTEEERKARIAGPDQYNPDSYQVICDDVAESIKDALTDGVQLMEVEFPAVPGGDASYKGSSDLFIDNNIQYAIQISRKLYQYNGKSIQILLPDGTEYRRAKDKFKRSLELSDGVSLNSLEDDYQNDPLAEFSTSKLGQFFGAKKKEEEDLSFEAGMYIVINLSTKDLPTVEQFVKEKAKGTPVLFLNDELDTLRADLGLPFFPGKDIHFRFLSQVKPVFYIRSRDYSKTVSEAPFIINYSGALFRQYPGPWQVMIKQKDSGSLVCVAEDRSRYALGAAKEEMLKALGLNDEEGSTEQFLRTGYAKRTWWEEEPLKENNVEEHDAWRK